MDERAAQRQLRRATRARVLVPHRLALLLSLSLVDARDPAQRARAYHTLAVLQDFNCVQDSFLALRHLDPADPAPRAHPALMRAQLGLLPPEDAQTIAQDAARLAALIANQLVAVTGTHCSNIAIAPPQAQ
jgi:hypothetical protein